VQQVKDTLPFEFFEGQIGIRIAHAVHGNDLLGLVRRKQGNRRFTADKARGNRHEHHGLLFAEQEGGILLNRSSIFLLRPAATAPASTPLPEQESACACQDHPP